MGEPLLLLQMRLAPGDYLRREYVGVTVNDHKPKYKGKGLPPLRGQTPSLEKSQTWLPS